MRIMVMIKADERSEAGEMPSEELLTQMGQFNEELVKAGVMLDGDGLHPSAKGARVRWSGRTTTVIDGPFAEAKALVAGYSLWQVKSMDEARRITIAPAGVGWLKAAAVPHPEAGAASRSRHQVARIGMS